MTIFSTRSEWEAAAGGSSVTAVSFSGVSTSEAVSNYADGQTIVGGCLAGLKVSDPSGYLTTLADDGTDCLMTMANGGTAMPNGDASLNNVFIYWPQLMMGDFDIAVKVSSTGVGSFNRDFAIGAFSGDTAGRASCTQYVFEGWQSTTTKTKMSAAVSNTLLNSSQSLNIDFTVATWRRIAVVGGGVSIYNGGTDATPTWVQQGTTAKGALHGGTFRVGLVAYAGAGTQAFEVQALTIDGFEYTATP